MAKIKETQKDKLDQLVEAMRNVLTPPEKREEQQRGEEKSPGTSGQTGGSIPTSR